MPYKDQDTRKKYHKDFHKRWYAANREMRRKQLAEREKDIKAWIADFKKSLRCELCGENHPGCLDFHHLDPLQKDIGLSAVVKAGWSIARIKAEIEKCRVLCSNCHRKLHYEEGV